MNHLLINASQSGLWQELVKYAEKRSSIFLQAELETYLIALLMRYTNKPELAHQVIAQAFLHAQNMGELVREHSLQDVGDQCLLFAGLFPRVTEKKLVKIKYFVDIGQTAYASVSKSTNDVFCHLALRFVMLMDVLQSIREAPDLLPIQAYEQWEQVGSQRALQMLKSYAKGIPVKK